MVRFAPLGLLAGLFLIAAGAGAGAQPAPLDPRIAQPLMALLQMAGQQCQMGNQQGCMIGGQLQQAGSMFTAAQYTCNQGDPAACQMLQMGAQQLGAMYQQAMMAQAQPLQDPNGGYAGGAPAPGFGMMQQNQQHMQAMQNIQNFGMQNSQAFENRMKQMDINQSQFLGTLR